MEHNQDGKRPVQEPLPEKKKARPQKRNHKWVVKNQAKEIEERLKDEQARIDPDTMSPDEVAARTLEIANVWSLRRMEAEVKQNYLQRLAQVMANNLKSQVAKSTVEAEQAEAMRLAVGDITDKYRLDAEKEKLVSEVAVRVARREAVVERESGQVIAQIKLNEVSLTHHAQEARMARAPLEEGIKDAQIQAAHDSRTDEYYLKINEVAIAKEKSVLQRKQMALTVAPDDHYVLNSADDFEFKLTREKFQLELRPAILALISLVLLVISAAHLPWLVVFLFFATTMCLATLVGYQIVRPELRYSKGDISYYTTRQHYAEVPGKPALDGDVRMMNDRKDLVQYDGLVRFCDVTRCYVDYLKFMTFKLPIRVHKTKKTLIAVSMGLTQQVITKRVSYSDSESTVRSKIEYNMTNMTCVNVDKELMYIRSPDTGKKHGFAVFQQTVDFAWGWFMSRKEMDRHVPRPRVEVSPPLY